MADDNHVAQLRKGARHWNVWRKQNPEILPDLIKADFRGSKLSEANLGGEDLTQADLRKADLRKADLRDADLTEAKLNGADLAEAFLRDAYLTWAHLAEAKLVGAKLGEASLREAHLQGANLALANLSEADLTKANFARANLTGAELAGGSLERAILVDTNLTHADLTGCRIHGVSAWRLNLERAKQQDLVITNEDEPEITIDNVEVAQFVYLMLHNEKVRDVIDTITSKAVLILGRFAAERKAVLHMVREELRKRDYLPILFDFEKPASKDLTGTVQTLANMARFVIADLTDPSSVPHEIAMVAPGTVVPIQPVLGDDEQCCLSAKDGPHRASADLNIPLGHLQRRR